MTSRPSSSVASSRTRLDQDVLVLVLGVGDEQRRTPRALDVLGPPPALGRVQDDVVAVGVDRDERRVDRSVLVERRDVAKVAAPDELAHRVGERCCAAISVLQSWLRPQRYASGCWRRPVPAARCGGRSGSRARCSWSSGAPPRCSSRRLMMSCSCAVSRATTRTAGRAGPLVAWASSTSGTDSRCAMASIEAALRDLQEDEGEDRIADLRRVDLGPEAADDAAVGRAWPGAPARCRARR